MGTPEGAAPRCPGAAPATQPPPLPPPSRRPPSPPAAPHVVIWSAVACSSAFPGLFQPQELLARNAAGQLVKFTSEAAGGDGDGGGSSRRWRDGSLEQDLPLRGLRWVRGCEGAGCGGWVGQGGRDQGGAGRPARGRGLGVGAPVKAARSNSSCACLCAYPFARLWSPPWCCSEMFSANHFIVSQTNPHIVPFLNLKRRLGTVGAVAESEFTHRRVHLGCCGVVQRRHAAGMQR